MCLRELRDEFGIAFGFRAAQRMIEVDGRERDSEVIAQAQQQAQQRYGIRAAGDGYGHTVTGREHPGALNGLQYGLFERCPHRLIGAHADAQRVLMVAVESGRVERGAKVVSAAGAKCGTSKPVGNLLGEQIAGVGNAAVQRDRGEIRTVLAFVARPCCQAGRERT